MTDETIFEGGKLIEGRIWHLLVKKVWKENDVLVHYIVSTDLGAEVEIMLNNNGNWIEKGGTVTPLSTEAGKIIDASLQSF